MAFWTDRSVEPKREFRWVLMSANIPKWIIKGVTKPQLTVTDTAHKYHGYTFYYPGTGTWNTVDITLVDPVAPDSANLIAAIMYRSGYSIPTDPQYVTTISKKNASESLGAIQIRQVDSEGKPIETWTLNNPFATIADFGGSLSYDNENLMNLKLTLRYDWATLETANSSVQLGDVAGRKASRKYWKP